MIIKSTRSKVRVHDGYSDVLVTTTFEHNINHAMQVRVTQYGMKIWTDTRLNQFSDQWRNVRPSEQDFVVFREKFLEEINERHVGDGWYEFQTYEVWQLFGSYMHQSATELPFETTVRYVETRTEFVHPADS